MTPRSLERLSPKSGVVRQKEGKKEVVSREGDIRMQGDMGTYSVIFAEETQNKVHYAMPVRVLLYDALEYAKQVQMLEKQHKERGDKLGSREFLSGIAKTDKIKPVVTIVLYFGGGEEWDGSKSLYEMLGIDDKDENTKFLRRYLPEYKLNLIQTDKIEDPEMFQTCLQHIFQMLKYRKDKKKLFRYAQNHVEELEKMDGVETMAMVTLLGEQKRLEQILKKNRREAEPNMASALTELIMDGMAEGRTAGEIGIIRKKLKQGMPAEMIGEWTEWDVEYIRRVGELLKKYPAESDEEIAGRYLNYI